MTSDPLSSFNQVWQEDRDGRGAASLPTMWKQLASHKQHLNHWNAHCPADRKPRKHLLGGCKSCVGTEGLGISWEV